MQFYSGFSLKDDKKFFTSLMQDNEFYIYGFSYGAIKALYTVKEKIQNQKRVDKLILFSPAFFQTTTEKFKRLQLLSFKKDKSRYMDNFLRNCFFPHIEKKVTLFDATEDELKELLYFQWIDDMILEITEKGVILEVYLGEKDAIIDVEGAYNFFKRFGDVILIKNANHFCQEN